MLGSWGSRGDVGRYPVWRTEVGCFGAVKDGELAEEFAFGEGLGGFGNETVEEVESADAVDDVVGRAQDEVAADGG